MDASTRSTRGDNLEKVTDKSETDGTLGVSAAGTPWSVEAGKEMLEGETEVVEGTTFPGRREEVVYK